jgi:hypothetical protein
MAYAAPGIPIPVSPVTPISLDPPVASAVASAFAPSVASAVASSIASGPPVQTLDRFESLLRATLDPESWLAVSPGMHIGGGRLRAGEEAVAAREVGDEELREVLCDLRAEGYLELSDLIAPGDAARLEATASRLYQFGLPPVFTFIYDEPWHAAARMGTVLSAALGPGYRQLPDFWAWFIPPSAEGRGWVPHRDRPATPRQDGLPATVTLWMALSEATPKNGCMYVLPRGRDPRFGTSQIPEIPRDALQDVRALPASPGTVLIWDQDIYHWGGRSSTLARRPRVSLACEFQRGDFPAYNSPLIDPREPPDFAGRLRLIGKQLRQYQHMHPLSPMLARLAERLVLL